MAICHLFKPAGLSPDTSHGYRWTSDEEESLLSYLDLATGVIKGSMPKRVGVMEEASG
jgi:hypothetical protein